MNGGVGKGGCAEAVTGVLGGVGVGSAVTDDAEGVEVGVAADSELVLFSFSPWNKQYKLQEHLYRGY